MKVFRRLLLVLFKRRSLKLLAERSSFDGVDVAKVLVLLSKLSSDDVKGERERVYLFKIWILADKQHRLKNQDCFQWHHVMAECSALSRQAEEQSVGLMTALGNI